MTRLTPRLPIGALVAAGSLLVAACASESEDAQDTTTTTVVDDTTTTTEVDDTTSTTTEAPTPEVDVPDGFTLEEGDGILVAVPSSWLALDLADGQFEGFLDEAVEQNPELEDVLDAQVRNLVAQGAVFFAIEVGLSDFSPNVNIIRVPGAVPDDPSELESIARQGITQVGGDVLDVAVESLSAGEALRVRYDATVPDGAGGEVEFSGVQFYVLADAAYVVTVSFELDGDATIADAIAGSLTET